MRIRIVLGAAMLAGVVGVLWLDWFLEDRGFHLVALPVTALLAAVAVLAFGELGRLARPAGLRILGASGLASVLAVGTLPTWWHWLSLDLAVSFANCRFLVVLGLAAMAIFAQAMSRRRTEGALADLAVTALAVVYLGVGMALVLLIRTDFGAPVLVLFLAAVKFTDIGAYFVGSAIGRHKLIPWLSPGKSWEGLAGGMVTAAGVSALAAWLLRIDVFGPPLGDGAAVWRTLVFGAAVGAAGQFADLCESLLKRSAGVKDSGTLVPQFGGVLDIIDSPLLAGPVAIVLLNVLK